MENRMFRCYNLHLLLFIVCPCSPKFRRMQLFLWNLLGLVQDLSTDINTHRCSSPLSKMAWYLFITYGINIRIFILIFTLDHLLCQTFHQYVKHENSHRREYLFWLTFNLEFYGSNLGPMCRKAEHHCIEQSMQQKALLWHIGDKWGVGSREQGVYGNQGNNSSKNLTPVNHFFAKSNLL